MEIPNFVLGDFNPDINQIISGGEANVFIGSHSSHGKVAAKKWHKNYYDMMRGKTLLGEIQILMKNPYEHIIKVIGFLIDEESNCIGYVMPYMAIGSLEDVVHNKGKSYDDIYTNEQKTTWITQICRGLSHLHSNNIIHRDIKPRESYDDVKLSDFGIARSVVNMTHSLTTSMGTYPYMAPEMFKSEDYTFSADIYSLSITIWEILHRRYRMLVISIIFKIPYDHITRKFDLLSQISNGERPELEDDLSEEVSDFLTKCWDDDATERPKINETLEFCSNKKFTPSKRTETEPKNQAILLLGGVDGNNWDSLLMLKNNGQNWKESNIKLPYAIENHGAQFLNNNIYIFGGQNANGFPINLTYKLSKSLQWEKMADMNEERRDISNSSVILNNQIWVCGGENIEEHVLESVEVYDPETNKWKFMREMNECRRNAAAVVVNGKIFCFGNNSGECYDPSSDVWILLYNTLQDIGIHSAVEINGALIVIGGYNVWSLDTTDRNAEWIEKPSMSIPHRDSSIAKIDDKIFVCGGDKEGDIVEIFDGEDWRNGPKMPTYRRYAPAVVIPMQFGKSLK